MIPDKVMGEVVVPLDGLYSSFSAKILSYTSVQ
jgi:hypothetical protein